MTGITPTDTFGHSVNDAPEYRWVDTQVALYDVLGGSRRHRPSSYLGQQAELGVVWSNQLLDFLVGKSRVAFSYCLYPLFSGWLRGDDRYHCIVTVFDREAT